VPLPEGIFTAFHDIDNFPLGLRVVDASTCDMDLVIGIGAGKDLFRITENRKVGIVGGEYELSLWFEAANEFYHILVNRLVVQIVFRLIDEKQIVFLSA